MIYAYPRVIPAGSSMNIELRSNRAFFGNGEWYALFTPCEKFINTQDAIQVEVISGFPISHTTNRAVRLPLTGTGLFSRTIHVDCPVEQEYIIRIFSPCMPEPVAHVEIYAVDEDLQGLYPYKGDFHNHSTYSDGKDAPRRMAQIARRKGYDFMALTDHGKFFPSVALQEVFIEMPDLAMKTYTGEEVHLPYHQAHILNVGGTYSVNDLFFHNRDTFFEEIQKMQESTNVPETVDPYTFCSALWAFEQIRQAGGMSIFCHCYWRRPGGYELSSVFTEEMLKLQPFDAMELISGYPQSDGDSNLLQLSRYFELEKKPPVVGVSDAHTASPTSEAGGEEMMGSFYTMVLAKSNSFEDIRDGILSMHSAAVDHVLPEHHRIYGPYRMVKYFQFLQRTFYPEHDLIAYKEAGRMELWNAERLGGMKKEMDELFQRVFAW